MLTKVQKWGNSLALRIPESFATELGLQRETPVEVTLVEGKLVVTPIVKPKPTLRQLLAKATKENLHHEVDTGPRPAPLMVEQSSGRTKAVSTLHSR